jgi:hypothetical protein
MMNPRLCLPPKIGFHKTVPYGNPSVCWGQFFSVRQKLSILHKIHTV